MIADRSPRVSVIIPVYNTEKYVGEAIESILAQTFTDFELIIVDDGSSDGSPEIIREYEGHDARIRVIRFARNAGEWKARSAGLAAARGEFIAWQDSDDISLPERLEKQARFLQANPDTGAVGVYARVVTEDLQPTYDREPPAGHAEIILNHYVGVFTAAFVHASMMLRRNLLLEAGDYDESLRYGADCDLLTRLLGRTRFANIAEPLYVYRRRPGQDTAHDNPQVDRDLLQVRHRRYERIIGARVSLDSLDRLYRIRKWSKLTWRERRAAKRDITRLIDAFIAAGWVDAGDRPRLIAVMNRQLELVSPRLWQMLCHWYRHRIKRHLASTERFSK